jgi:hypothetical protein
LRASSLSSGGGGVPPLSLCRMAMLTEIVLACFFYENCDLGQASAI